MHKLWARFGHLVQEIGKFGVVGGIAFVVDFSIYAFCLQGLGMETLTAKAIAASIAATLAFFGNRFWTWRHRERSGLAREYGLYFFFNLVGIGVALGTLALTHYGLGSVWPIFFRRRPPTTSLPSSWHGARHARPVLVVPDVRLRSDDATARTCGKYGT